MILLSRALSCLLIMPSALMSGACSNQPTASPRATETIEGDTSIPLFDGITLDGWIKRGGNAAYTVEDGAIVGRTAPNQPNTFLCTELDHADFILTLEFKVDDDLNSGIQFRSASRADYQNGRVHGYQVEIDPSDRAWTGGIYDEGRRGWLADLSGNQAAREAFKHGDWNALRIEAVGDHIRTWINGVPAADLRDSMEDAGFIALQVHGVGDRVEPLEVRWRNIQLRPIQRPVTAPPSHAEPDPAAAPPPSR